MNFELAGYQLIAPNYKIIYEYEAIINTYLTAYKFSIYTRFIEDHLKSEFNV